uniref:Uncharacterized protein n=4 Tax=Oryza TaxID=4527 RepID=A0A0D3F4M5_9ORYZ
MAREGIAQVGWW